ncbi:MAG TPA: DUF1318 domain-containing protein [bacterium]|nr:DUF1318 domain-containing protein [bacterium]
MNHPMKMWGALAALILLAASCSVKAPEVRVTGEMTALEKEVLGTYRQIEQDTWMVASTRSSETGQTASLSPEKKRVLDAKQRQRFNQDDVEEFKKKGFVGEDNQGFLAIMESEGLGRDPDRAALVKTIVGEENADRELIIDRVIELNENLKNTVRNQVLAIFAEMNQKNSPVGTWIQDQVGKWIKKTE